MLDDFDFDDSLIFWFVICEVAALVIAGAFAWFVFPLFL